MAVKELKNFINGQYVDSKGSERSDVINPATGQTYATAAVSSDADVDSAYKAAEKAFDVWSNFTPSERQLALFRIADSLAARAEEAADVESENTGKPRPTLVEYEMDPSVDQIRFFAGAARNLEGRATAEYARDHTSSIRREPIGVIGQVTPWNYPLNMAVWKFAPALAAGNTIVLKPSDTTPVSTLLLAEIAAEHLPPGVFNVVTGNRDTGRALIEHEIPQMVSITGSVRAGMEVAKAASADAKSTQLLNTQLVKNAGATKLALTQNDKFIEALSLETGIMDDDLRPSMGKLVRATKDVDKAQQLLTLSLDAATVAGKPVETVSQAMARAFTGNRTALVKLFPTLKESKDLFGDLEKIVGGAAIAQADPFMKLNNSMDILKEKLGVVVLPILVDFIDEILAGGKI